LKTEEERPKQHNKKENDNVEDLPDEGRADEQGQVDDYDP